jgi:O-antigen ligase
VRDEVQSDDFAQGRQSTVPAAWIVGFFFSVRVFILVISVRFFGLEPYAGASVGLALNFFLFGIVALDKIGRPALLTGGVFSAPERRWAFCFLALSGCSLGWSVTVSVPAAVAFWCAMAADAAMILLLVRLYSVGQVATDLMMGFVCGACAIAVIAWIMPVQSDLRLGDEELLGPNQIAYVCAIAFLFSQYIARIVGRGKWYLPAALLAITVVRALSKTTIAALLVAQAYLFVWDRSLTRKARVLMLFGVVLIVAVFWNLFFSYIDVYSGAGNQAETLTGRVGLWAIFLDQSLQQPWIGHGFHSAWKVIPPFGPDQFEARHAHNELLQQFYAYGILGVFVLLGLYRSFFRKVRTLPIGPLRTWLFSLFLFVLVRGLADTEPFDLSLPLWAIVLFSYLIEVRVQGPEPARVPVAIPHPPLKAATQSLGEST